MRHITWRSSPANGRVVSRQGHLNIACAGIIPRSPSLLFTRLPVELRSVTYHPPVSPRHRTAALGIAKFRGLTLKRRRSCSRPGRCWPTPQRDLAVLGLSLSLGFRVWNSIFFSFVVFV